MNDDTYKALLKDLQKLEKRIADAHIARVRGDAKEQARLAALHAAAEVGGRADDYVAMQARKSAVQFLLRTVYVRVLEDLGTLEPVRIRGGWGEDAFRAIAPALGKRAYFEFIFRDLARDFPALFTRGADELELPAEDLCRDAWALWHKEDGRGNILYDWRPVEADGDAASFDSRFLGDLYQDLDAEVRKRYALLQTPVFVERYILDKTLTPALVEFDPAALRAAGETFRVLDPTCGSGHFLVGAFHRMAAYWQGKGLGTWEAAERALESVWGSDINPHAVDIARFRLLLEVRGRTGVNDVERLAGLKLNLAVLDSLIPWEQASSLFPAMDRLAKYATAEERKANAEFLGRAFHVVVGNPPYITPKDVQKRDDYRAFWPDSCHKSYALSAPFGERFFVLGASGAYAGQITANSFMKREFGKKLVETVFRRWNLTGIVDASGAYIPGHGTPTVILLGRALPADPTGTVLAILGKRGEPKRPKDPAQGLVWTAILHAGASANDSNPFISVAQLARSVLAQHPWTMGGGAITDIMATICESAGEELEARLPMASKNKRLPPGRTTVVGEDDVWIFDQRPPALRGLNHGLRQIVLGVDVGDFGIEPSHMVVWPYVSEDEQQRVLRWLHPWRRLLAGRTVFGKTVAEHGRAWWSHLEHYGARLRQPMGVCFAFVATHNHFALDETGRVFKQSALVIKLPPSSSKEDHHDLLGLLNSSSLGFWMKQVFHDKGNRGTGGGITAEDWERFHEYDATKLQRAPLTTADRQARIALAAALDSAVQSRAACLPRAILNGNDWTAIDLAPRLARGRAGYAHLTALMVALQEELDWLTYSSYNLIDPPVETVAPNAVELLAPGHRPFEILFARADAEAEPDEKSAWWSRHGHDRVTEVPAGYSLAHRARLEHRIARIEEDPRLQLIETPAFKRRWQTPDLAKAEKEAAESWLLDRLEDLFAPKSDQSKHSASAELAEPKPYRLEAVVAAWQRDPRVATVAGVWTGSGAATDLTLVAEKLLRKNAIPDNPYRVYTPEGLLKLGEWKRVWALQDQEDAKVTQLSDPRTNAPLLDEAGKPTNTIPLPPKFDKADFQADYFATRGKLNVPRERFIAFTDLTPTRYGWNGWRDRERALAQVEAYTLAETDPELPLPVPTSADPRRCGPTLGLWESLPDVKRWASADEHAELSSLAQEVCRQTRCPCPVVEKWQAWRRGDLKLGAEGTGATTTVSVAERAALMALFVKDQAVLLGATQHEALPLESLVARWKGTPERLAVVLDDLVATGDLVAAGRAGHQRYTRTNLNEPRSSR